MKKLTKVISVVLVLCMLFSLAACGKKEDPPKTETVTVSFDTDGGDEVPSQVISKGGSVVKPATPKRIHNQINEVLSSFDLSVGLLLYTLL